MLPFSMDFNLSPSQLAAETAARALGDELPAIIDAADVIRAAARHRLLDVTHDLLGTAVIVETVAHASAAAGIALALHISVLRSIGDHPAVDALASGEDVGALALSSDEQPTGGPQLSGRASWVAPEPPKRGYYKLYVEHVQQADKGADLDFLVGGSGTTVTRDSH